MRNAFGNAWAQTVLPARHGWRLEDDTAFVRQVTGISFATPDKGVELGYESEAWTAQLSVTNGTAGGPEQDSGKQVSLRAVFHLDTRVLLVFRPVQP
jgi:hypothetical protein